MALSEHKNTKHLRDALDLLKNNKIVRKAMDLIGE